MKNWFLGVLMAAVALAACGGGGGGVSIIHVIRIVMGVTALIMIITTVALLLPMFHAVDSSLRGRIENRPAIKSVLSENGSKPVMDNTHHGVHKNVQDHMQGLQDLMDKERAKRKIQSIVAKKTPTYVDSINAERHEQIVSKKSESNDAARPAQKLDKNPASPTVKKSSSRSFVNAEPKLARGFSGLPMEKTPALIGAERGTIECDVNVKCVPFLFACVELLNFIAYPQYS